MRNINITKYRKLLYTLQFLCKSRKRDLHYNSLWNRNRLTDFERGRIEGMHAAYNDVLRKVQEMMEYADTEWDHIECRKAENRHDKRRN